MLGDAGVGMGEAGEGGSGAVVGGVRGRVSRGEWGGVARPRGCRGSRGAGGGVAGHRGVTGWPAPKVISEQPACYGIV